MEAVSISDNEVQVVDDLLECSRIAGGIHPDQHYVNCGVSVGCAIELERFCFFCDAQSPKVLAIQGNCKAIDD